ncbi:MAG: hypothetical protein ACFBWO_10165 [Paracoccaceae bacterium]
MDASTDRPHEPTLDRDRLERLGDWIGAGALAELLADGALSLAERAQRLDRLGPVPCPEAARALAHELAGLAGNIGLAALAARAGRLAERAHARRGEGARLPHDGSACPPHDESARLPHDERARLPHDERARAPHDPARHDAAPPASEASRRDRPGPRPPAGPRPSPRLPDRARDPLGAEKATLAALARASLASLEAYRRRGPDAGATRAG